MQLVSETKTYSVPFSESVDYPGVSDVVKEIMASMPEWSMVSYRFDALTWEIYVTVRRTV